jgi:hypothetical protein
MCEKRDNAKGAGKFLDVDTWDALKKAGYSEEELQKDQPFGPVIFSYTRKQAIEDGVLIDVSEVARQEGFTLHTVVTCGVWSEIGTDRPLEDRPKAVAELLRVLRREIRLHREDDRIDFKFGDLAVWALVGPGDEGEPVLTVMLEGED